jgi:hypothetical protein
MLHVGCTWTLFDNDSEDAQQFPGSLETTWLHLQKFLYWMDAAINWQH